MKKVTLGQFKGNKNRCVRNLGHLQEIFPGKREIPIDFPGKIKSISKQRLRLLYIKKFSIL